MKTGLQRHSEATSQLRKAECILRKAVVPQTKRNLGAHLQEERVFFSVIPGILHLSMNETCHMGCLVLAQAPTEALGNKKEDFFLYKNATLVSSYLSVETYWLHTVI